MKIFIGDIDEYYCDAVSGDDKRWAVWSVDLSSGIERLLGRFGTEGEAEKFAENMKNSEL